MQLGEMLYEKAVRAVPFFVVVSGELKVSIEYLTALLICH
jgi:hypothetical protein